MDASGFALSSRWNISEVHLANKSKKFSPKACADTVPIKRTRTATSGRSLSALRECIDEVFVSSIDFSFFNLVFCATAVVAESSAEGICHALIQLAQTCFDFFLGKRILRMVKLLQLIEQLRKTLPVRRLCVFRALTGQSAHPESLLPDHSPNATGFAPTGHRYCQTLRACEHQASHSPPSLYLSNQVKCYTYFSHFNKSSLQCILARNNFMRLASREMPYSWAISLCDSRYS